MDQLIVLHEIYDSFSKGPEKIKAIDPSSIEGGCSEQMGRLLECAKLGKIDQDICKSLLDSFDDVFEMKRLGDICRKAGYNAIAIKSYNKALLKNKDQSIRPVLLSNLGQVYIRNGDLGRANIYYKKALDCFDSMGDSSGMAHVLGHISAAYRKAKDWDKAVEHCYRGLKIFEGLGDELGVARATGSLGRIYADMGELDLAVKYFEKSLNDFRRLGDRRSVAWILDRLGQISAAEKNWDEALKYYNRSITEFEELGQDRSMGTAMSNLGRTYLEKGDAAAAIDQLEKATKLMKRDMQPAYQNAVECMAAAYGALATMHMQGAELSEPRGLGKITDDKLKQASQLYARSSDRYLEIASTKGFDLPEIKVSAGIMRSLSYLARLKSGFSDGEAVALAERAASALDSAVINSEGAQKENIEAFQRILIGIKEALSSGIAEGEPWRLTKFIASSTDYLLSGACSADDCGKSLCDALRTLGGAIEAERQRADPSEQLKATIANLGRAKAAFESAGTIRGSRNASEIDGAIKFANDLMEIVAKGSTAQSYSRISDLMNYRAYRDILLTIGWILVDDAISRINRADRIYVWDETLNPAKRFVDNEYAAKGLNEDVGQEGIHEPLPWSVPDIVDLDDPGSDKGAKIIPDVIEPDITEVTPSSEVSLVSVETDIACSSPQAVIRPKEAAPNKEPENSNINAKDSENIIEDALKSDGSVAAKGYFAKIAGFKGIFTQAGAIRLTKAMSVMVLVLLVIDAILYLI
ncbi:MAG: tetratricopeptide repeat protein [Methanotrichaceae archaeon]